MEIHLTISSTVSLVAENFELFRRGVAYSNIILVSAHCMK